MIVVADTSPINYLVLIDASDILSKLFGSVIIPRAVANELRHIASPVSVQSWIESPPQWLTVQTPAQVDLSLDLEAGEREAIALAEELHADALLVDEHKARQIARQRGLSITGTLGIIKLASVQGFLDARQALSALRQTNFFIDEAVIQHIFGAGFET